MIRFRKDTPRYWFMSNYYSCEFVMNGIRYKNAEAAFQSHKVPLEERKQFSDMPPATAKHFGRHVAFPANWDETRDDVMRRVVMAKFEQNKDLKQRLLETGTQPIEEDTTSWHDNYWGNCHCPKCRNIPGQNRLGIILMETRDKLKSLTTTIDQYEQPQHPKAQKDAAHINKHAMHIVRLYYTAFDILEKGEIITRRDKEREELLAIRNGKYLREDGSYAPEFFELVDALEKRFQDDVRKTPLPAKPDFGKIEELLVEINKSYLRRVM